MWLDHAWRDLRYAVRTLGRAPGFTAIAVLTLALGIGANTAMFSVVYGILLRPFPYGAADRLVLIQREQDMTGAHRPIPALFNSPAEIDAWQRRLESFDATALYSIEVAALSAEGGSEVLDSAVVSANFFSTLAGPLSAGRPLGAADDLAPSIVISKRLSQRLFGTPGSAIAQRLSLSSHVYTIVGVAGAGFQVPAAKTDVWMPAGFVRGVTPRCCGFRMLARLKPGVTITHAGAEVAATAAALDPAAARRRSPMRASVVSLRDEVVGAIRLPLLVLFAAVTLVLLVSCANLVNVLLARQITRDREGAIRSALGASRFRLVQQSILETVVLATGGAALGIALAAAGVRILKSWQPPGVPRLDAVHVDVPVLLFSIAVGALTAIAAGLLPAWQSANPADALRLSGNTTTGAPQRMRVRRILCAAELAVSLVLLVGASLLGRSLVRLMHVDIGVTTDHVVTASMNLAFGRRPTDAQTLQRVERVIDAIRTVPGVQAVGAGTALPPTSSRIRLTLRRAGDVADYQATGVAATPEYFHALGMRLVSGRLFTADDDVNHPPVMIMSVDTARRFFGDGNPIGRTMTLPVSRNGVNAPAEMTLVGTIANVRFSGLDAAADDAVYRPFKQQTWVAPYLVVRTTAPPESVAAALPREIAAVDRDIVVSDVRALDSIVSDAAAQPRFRTLLLAAIAGLALLVAVIGLYGVTAYSVSQRTKEIGIRMALGADVYDVRAMVLRDGLILAAFGIAVGLLAAFATTRVLASLLYGIAPTDAASFGLAAASLLIVALVATYVPARRATRVDPLAALRSE